MNAAHPSPEPRRRGTWVVGFDGSNGARHAALWAVEQAAGRAERVEVATVWTPPAAPALPPYGPMTRYWDEPSWEKQARDCGEELVDELISPPGVAVDVVVARGQSSAVLLSRSRDASLLVVGTRGHGGFARLVLGSTSSQCATHANAPTAVIPQTAPLGPIARILVAVDGSEHSLRALRWALDFAPSGAEIECLDVWNVTAAVVAGEVFPLAETRDLVRDRFERQVDSIRAAAGDRRRSANLVTRFVEGTPRTEIADAASRADLLVMGTRGHGAVGAALLGSVSTWLLHHVDTAMVVVPPARHADTDTAESTVTTPRTETETARMDG